MNEEKEEANPQTNQTTSYPRPVISIKPKSAPKSTPKPSNHYHPDPEQFLKTRQVCKLFGVYESTVRGWELSGKIKAIKTPAGHRRFDKQSVLAYLAQNQANQKITAPEKNQFIYCRVSSKHQNDDLQRQINHLQSKYPDHQLVQDIGSGINFRRKGLQTILDAAISGNLKELVVAHRDRLARFGFELIEYIIRQQGGKITVLDSETNQSTENELAEDLLSIIAVFNARAMGRRRYSKKSKNTSEDHLQSGSSDP